jgi:hypothetical protein
MLPCRACLPKREYLRPEMAGGPAEAARRDARAALGSVLRGSGQTVDVSELAR